MLGDVVGETILGAGAVGVVVCFFVVGRPVETCWRALCIAVVVVVAR
jgi:hypothetical protein